MPKPVVPGVNDLQSQFPDIAKEWHPIRNGDLKPSQVTRGSNKKFWWQCSKHPDHEWEANPNGRSKGQGCPICAGKRVLECFNDLKTTEPELAKEWHSTRNGDLKPSEVTRGSNKIVWWQCSKHPEHEWEAQPNGRSNGQGCPVCIGQKVLQGFNDLKTTEPELAKEWHPTRNGDLKPSEVTRGSNKKFWWQCSKHPDHEWEAAIGKRSNGRSCPICEGKRVLEGFNDLKTTEP